MWLDEAISAEGECKQSEVQEVSLVWMEDSG